MAYCDHKRSQGVKMLKRHPRLIPWAQFYSEQQNPAAILAIIGQPL